jgi:hypothetical protein
MIISAARLGELFGTDPIRLLDCEENEWIIRLACAKVISNDREEAEKRASKNT